MLPFVNNSFILGFYWLLADWLANLIGFGNQSEYRKIRTRKNSVFGHFSRSAGFDIIYRLVTLTFKIFFVDYICENQKKNIVCPGGKIKIQKAIFGRTEAKRCIRGNDFYCIIDVTDKIKKFCEDRESCLVVSSKEYLNIRFHPCFRYSKYLQIIRTCTIDGKIYI